MSGIVRDLDAVRARARSLDEIQVKVYGKVARALGDLAVLVSRADASSCCRWTNSPSLASQHPGHRLSFSGSAGARGRVLVESEPAIELEGVDEARSDPSGGRAFDPFAFGEVPVRALAADELRALLRRPGMLRVPRPIELVSRS